MSMCVCMCVCICVAALCTQTADTCMLGIGTRSSSISIISSRQAGAEQASLNSQQPACPMQRLIGLSPGNAKLKSLPPPHGQLKFYKVSPVDIGNTSQAGFT